MALHQMQRVSKTILQPRAGENIFRVIACNYMSGRNPQKSLPSNTIVKFVPQQEAWVVERFGKYHTTLQPGLNFLFPVIDAIRYVQSLKEIASDVPQQSAITRDNVTLNLDGVLYFKVVDPYQASYGVEDPQYAITQLAQTTMRSELGKINLDDVFKERAQLNVNIVEAINNAANVWGVTCLRYEIRDIQLPQAVRESMQMQVAAERQKRAAVLTSEGERESQINRATGEAQAILAKAKARAESIDMISQALKQEAGEHAASLSVAEQYIGAFGNLAKTGNTVILPANAGDVSGMVANALAVYGSLTKNNTPHSSVTDQDAINDENTDDSDAKPKGLGFESVLESPTLRRGSKLRH